VTQTPLTKKAPYLIEIQGFLKWPEPDLNW
jgi:hypothetical protein